MKVMTRRRVVLKIGSSTITGGTTEISRPNLVDLVRQLSTLRKRGFEVILVSSGAVAAGREVLRSSAFSKHVPAKQMLSAIGQPRLMAIYHELFSIYGELTAQVLLTRSDLIHRTGYLNARGTMGLLLENGVIPIVNENDAIATDEIRLGDNDTLSAHIAGLVGAETLVLMTDQDGLFDDDPGKNANAALIRRVAEAEIPDRVWTAAGGTRSGLGTDGKLTLTEAMVDRLMLNEGRIRAIAADVRAVVSLPDPVGEVFEAYVLPNGLRIEKRRTPIGVAAVLYESRPNVTVDAASLMIKAGNAVILRGGKETIRTNRILIELIHHALGETGLTADSVQFIDSPDRALMLELLHQDAFVDIVIPRGGNGLHRFCRENSRIPVITGGIGVCHLFVDASADLPKATAVVRNAKVQRPTVCNALETLLVHCTIADTFLPDLCRDLAMYGVEFRVDEKTSQILFDAGVDPARCQLAGPDDYDTEWLSLILSVRVVDDLGSAISHIRAHSTGHSDGILTGDPVNARVFMNRVNSACVYVNASTRFTDGSQLGSGAEIAISTQPLHARGPMALRELTTYKWVIQGDYQVRA